jgi:hypothetical protein
MSKCARLLREMKSSQNFTVYVEFVKKSSKCRNRVNLNRYIMIALVAASVIGSAFGGTSLKLFPNNPKKDWIAYYGQPDGDTWTLNKVWELTVAFLNAGLPSSIVITHVEGQPQVSLEQATGIMASIGVVNTWTDPKDKGITNWGDPTMGISASYDTDDGLHIWEQGNTILTYQDNSPEVVAQKVQEFARLMRWSTDPDPKEAGIQDGAFYADLVAAVRRAKHVRGMGPKIQEEIQNLNPQFHGDERGEYGLAFALSFNEEAVAKRLLKKGDSIYGLMPETTK